MQHDGTLDNFPFRGPFYIHKKAPIEQILQKNHKHGSRPNDLNKNKDTSENTGPPQATITSPCPKVITVQCDDPYDRIRHMEHTHENNHLIDTQEQDMENDEVEKNKLNENTNDEFFTEE